MKLSLVLPAALVLSSVAACSDETTVEPDGTEVTKTELADLIGSTDEISALASAFDRVDLTGIFEGPGGYTVLAPGNDALAPIAAGNPDEDNAAIVAAILRDHILPGQLDLAAINAALDANDGTVSITTLGSGRVNFTRQGEDISVRLDGNERIAKLTGSEKQGTNGAVLMIDQLLVVPPAE